MVLSRGLVISLGVSALGCTLLFLYFRNKISAVERKVDVMFDLIQNHQQQNSMGTQQYNEVMHEEEQQQRQQQQQQQQQLLCTYKYVLLMRLHTTPHHTEWAPHLVCCRVEHSVLYVYI